MDSRQHINAVMNSDFKEEIREIRRHLHQYPELSFEEVQTSHFIRKLLDQWKIDYRFPIVKTGIVASVKGGKPGPRIALRADMDALPVTEDSGEEFASLNKGLMHACGHDMHMSCLLGSIRILNEIREEIEGEILFVFQPGEEKLPGGAKLMLEEDLFEGRKPDYIIAQHVLPDMDAGNVGFKSGVYMASSDEIYLKVKGKGGHAALRDSLKDPVLMSSRILLKLQEEINSRAPKGIPTVLSFGRVEAAGATNVVPNEVLIDGTFRTMNEEWRKEAHGLIERISQKISREYGGDCEVKILSGYPVLHNHKLLTEQAAGLARELLGKRRVEDMDIRMTAEDFAWFTQEIPGMLYRFGVKGPDWMDSPSLHSSSFHADEAALETGTALLAYLAMELPKKISLEIG